jgi:riboflavin kinase/FMN adenylyltransferase
MSLKGYSDRCPLLLDACDFQSASPPAERPPGAPSPIPTVVTFYPHPQEFFSGQSRPWLTPLDEKAAIMKQLGVRQLVLLPFNAELSNLAPETFVETVLLERLQARHISVGADFRFGHHRAGDVQLLAQLAQRRGVQVTIVDLAEQGGDRISSSRIRQALCTGDMEQVHQLLGRPYRLMGRVIKGQQLGRTLGFPTANLRVPPEKVLPRTGVYSVHVFGVPGQPMDTGLPGVMNLGVRPTVDGQQQSIEVHLLNWQGDLYEQTLTVALKGFLRPEQRFESLDHLKAQIQADCQAALALL